MNSLKKISLICISTIILVNFSNAQVVLYKLGTHPFYHSSISSIANLKYMIKQSEDSIKRGFELASIQNIYNDFTEQFEKAEIVKINLKMYTEFDWMLARRYGKGPILISFDITWVGKNPIEVYQFHIDSGGKRYTFVVPLICGNLSLRGITNVPIIIKPQLNITENIIMEDNEIKSESLIPAPIIIKKSLKQKDDNFELSNVLSMNRESAIKINFLTDAGYFHQFDPARYSFVRAGIEKLVNDQLSIIGLVGIAPIIIDSEGKSAFIADLLLEYKLNKSYLDFGIGSWTTNGDENKKSENNQLDIIISIGTMFAGEKEKFNVSIFLEARNGIKEINSISNMSSYGRWGGGLRFRF